MDWLDNLSGYERQVQLEVAMKLALCMMFTNEYDFLALHTPVNRVGFDGIVGVTDPETTDGSIELMTSTFGASVLIDNWQWDWGNFATRLCRYAEALGYDAMVRLDPDEMLMPGAANELRRLLESEAALLCLARHEFFNDRLHVRSDLYPDWQARAWMLNRGIEVRGARHEGVDFGLHGLSEHSSDPSTKVLRVFSPHIFHYGWASKTGIWDNQVKYQMHAQIEAGGPRHVALPADTPLVSFPTVPFFGPQPLDPHVVGLYAPYKE